MVSLAKDCDGKNVLSRRPSKVYQAFSSSSNDEEESSDERPARSSRPFRRWRLRLLPFYDDPAIELPTARSRHWDPWQRTAPVPRWGGRRRRIRPLVVVIAVVALTLLVLIDQFLRAHGYRGEDAKETIKRLFRPSTSVFDQRELRRVWEWEIFSGHYPTTRKVPEQIGLRFEPKRQPRRYLDLKPVVPYPRRPQPGSVADFDRIMAVCDFDTKKYARDCLDFLAAGAGLGGRSRRTGNASHIFVEDRQPMPVVQKEKRSISPDPPLRLQPTRKQVYEETELGLCDVEQPRIFHEYWTGPLTDKGYVALLSFLYTQNLGLHLANDSIAGSPCQPQMWVWMDLNPGYPLPPPDAHNLLRTQLESNIWSAPFLHPRFQQHIQFRVWNATEQLDATSEVKDDWRGFPLLVSLGRKVAPDFDPGWVGAVLSDLARFILLHRYGGIYVDGDVIFLRDWEELWGWRGAFSYRWSVHDEYNTAVLRMNKGSALGSMLLRTTVRNGWDFHPFVVSRYLRDSHSSNLLYRLPDALFDPNWLHAEGQQRERPPYPHFDKFHGFSLLQLVDSSLSGHPFNSFFRGAFGYHSHLTRSTPFDPARNFPDLEPRDDADDGGRKSQEPQSEERLAWSAVLKRTFEAYVRGEQPNMYGERILWE